MVSGIFSQASSHRRHRAGCSSRLIVEHDLRQVTARNCRQRNGSICGRTGSLFFPGIPQHQQGKHAACQQDEEKQHPEVRCFAFMDRSSLSAPQHDHHGTHSQQGRRQNDDKEQAQRGGGNAGHFQRSGLQCLAVDEAAFSCPASEAAHPCKKVTLPGMT